ncbi:MAG: DUF721 domain-containing protein [Desulfovibrio sp.]|jgi:hypothetical protein|nr:DUF721 domain-containing protein [Desulfovibrio sp.]
MFEKKNAKAPPVKGPSRKREYAVRSTAEAVNSLFLHMGGKDQTRLVQLWRHWDMVLGEALAPLGRPLGHKDRALHIGADDNMAMQELSMQSAEILERANAFMGEAFFERVKVLLVQGRPDLARERENIAQPGQAGSWAARPAPPLGGLCGRLNPDSPVTRCYEAFVAGRK